MPDIFLYPGEADPDDVKLRDPTVLAGGGGDENFADSDTGAGVDDATLAADLSDAETGAGADDATLEAAQADSDAGVGADDASLAAALSDTETGAGADDAAVVADQSASDTGSGADDSTLAAALGDTESGSGVDDAGKEIDGVADDTGTGDDDASLAHARQTSESASGTDDAFVDSPEPSESGVGFDNAHVSKFGDDVAVVDGVSSACGPYSGPVTIRYDGIDITSCVLLESARFNSQANGAVGVCQFRVKDAGHAFDFVSGRSITLDIDGARQWGGFVGKVRDGFFFTGSIEEPGDVVRYFELTGVDYNVFFQKRILLDKVTPTNLKLTAFPAETPDDEVIKHYLDTHLDLSGDGLSQAGIEFVGTPSQDDEISGSASWTWGELMRFLRFNTGALDYIDPDKVIIHTDVDIPNAPFALTDQLLVDEPTYVRYRDVQIDHDGGAIRNDVFVWGLGKGAVTPVFRRETDDGSVDEHGLWQVGQVMSSVWRQETVDRIADSLVFGSPQSQRGGNDDAVAIQCFVFVPGFRVGMKVEFINSVFSFSEVFPIRTMEIDFPTPTDPRYRLVLSHEIDDPWSSMDPFEFDFPPIDFPPIDLPGFNFVLPPFDLPFGMIDSFDNRDDSTIIPEGPPGPSEGWWYASDYPAFLWTSGEAGVQRVYSGFGWLFQGGNDDPAVGNTLTDYEIYPDFIPAQSEWIGLWRFASPHTFASTDISVSVGVVLPTAPSYVMHEGILTVAEYFLMVRWTVDGPDLRAQAKMWTIWEDEPVGWQVDELVSLFTKPLSIRVGWEGPDSGGGGGIVRVDYVMQLSEASLPSFLKTSFTPRGPICEIPIVRNAPPGYPGGDSYFAIRAAYVPGSTRFYLDGKILRRGIDYGEGDPYYGHFLHVPSSVDVAGKSVYVCYDAVIGGA